MFCRLGLLAKLGPGASSRRNDPWSVTTVTLMSISRKGTPTTQHNTTQNRPISYEVRVDEPNNNSLNTTVFVRVRQWWREFYSTPEKREQVLRLGHDCMLQPGDIM